MMKKYIIPNVCFVALLMMSCEKFLDEKSRANLAVPTSAKDFQALLDHFQVMNHADVSAGEVSTTDYYVLDVDWAAQDEDERNAYLWEHSHVFSTPPNDWSNTYRLIYRANAVFHDMTKNNTPDNPERWNDIKGQALFHRARGYFQAVTTWSPAYDVVSAESDLGIPLRLDPDFNAVSLRASVQQTYRQITDDLTRAGSLLNTTTPSIIYRPSKAAAFALLSRVYLAMNDYQNALAYADSCLMLYDSLLNFNDLSANNFTIPEFNTEIIFYSQMYGSSRFLRPTVCRVNDHLYQSYAPEDLRKRVFFEKTIENDVPTIRFTGNYNVNTSQFFSGLTTAEVLLVRAECRTRLGDLPLALEDINRLLSHRIADDSFQEILSMDRDDILALVLTERRKELLFRGIRWLDIKRLNREGYGISLERFIEGQRYRLEANSPRFALPIPEEIITMSGMPQNTYE